MKTTITKTLGGKERDFNFGIFFMTLLEDYFDGLNNYDKAIREQPLRTSIVCLYLGARASAESKDEVVDFKLSDVYDWVDEVGIGSDEYQAVNTHLNKCLFSYVEQLQKKVQSETKKNVKKK